MDSRNVILLVEDNKEDEELTIRALRKNDVANEIVVAHDGEEALDYLLGRGPHANNPVLAQIVLLDLNLPKRDGLQVLRELRAHEQTLHLPVVILTSSGEDEDVLHSYSLRANAYVRKSSDFGQFAEAIKVLARFWLSLNRTPPRRKAP